MDYPSAMKTIITVITDKILWSHLNLQNKFLIFQQLLYLYECSILNAYQSKTLVSYL